MSGPWEGQENREGAEATTVEQGGLEAWLMSEVEELFLKVEKFVHSQHLEGETRKQGLEKAGLLTP